MKHNASIGWKYGLQNCSKSKCKERRVLKVKFYNWMQKVLFYHKLHSGSKNIQKLIHRLSRRVKTFTFILLQLYLFLWTPDNCETFYVT